jgi:hypothetical protein
MSNSWALLILDGSPDDLFVRVRASEAEGGQEGGRRADGPSEFVRMKKRPKYDQEDQGRLGRSPWGLGLWFGRAWFVEYICWVADRKPGVSFLSRFQRDPDKQVVRATR